MECELIFVNTSDEGNCDMHQEWICTKCAPKWSWRLIVTRKQQLKNQKKKFKKAIKKSKKSRD